LANIEDPFEIGIFHSPNRKMFAILGEGSEKSNRKAFSASDFEVGEQSTKK
jgi:hypothetical protein